MAEQITSKNPSCEGFDGYVCLREATGRQSQYASRYIEPCWSRNRPEGYPYLGEGLKLMYCEYLSKTEGFVLIAYNEEKHRGDYHSFYLSSADAQIFKQRLDAL